MPRWLTGLLVLTVCASCQMGSWAADGVSLGLICSSSPGVDAKDQVGFVDTLCTLLTRGGRVSTVVLSSESPIVKTAGVDIVPLTSNAPEAADVATLFSLPDAFGIDEILLFQLSRSDAGLRAHGLWVKTGASAIKQVDVTGPNADLRQCAQALAGVIDAGFGQAPAFPAGPAPVTLSSASSAATPAPASSGAPVAQTVTSGVGQTTASTAAGEDLLNQAEAALRERRFESALGLVTQAANVGAAPVQCLLMRTLIYELSGDVERARGELEGAIRLDPHRPQAMVHLAEMELARGLWQLAIDLCLQSVKDNPEYVDGYLRAYEIYQQHDQPRKALEILEQARTANPESVPVLMRLGAVYVQRNVLVAAEAVYKRVIAVGTNAESAGALARLGDLYTAAENYGAAFEAYVAAAKATGAGNTASGYDKIFAAADQSVQVLIDAAWVPFLSFMDDGPVTRVEAYAALSQALADLGKIREFAQKATVPPDRSAVQAQRQLYYQVVYEAGYSALIYLDTGDAETLGNARDRKEQAAKELESIALRPKP